MIVQVYAFTELDQAVEAARLGVDHIGFVAGDYGLVHGELSFRAARKIVDALPATARAVALTMSTDVSEIVRMADQVRPAIVHISTDLDDVGPTAMVELRQRLPSGMLLMKAVPVQDEASVAAALLYAPLCDYLLLDSKVKDFPGVGATGAVHDWSISRRIVQTASIPVILAGGLNSENVQDAIHQVAPAGVDSNTHTNLPGDPVRKDMARVRAFVQAARAGEAGIRL